MQDLDIEKLKTRFAEIQEQLERINSITQLPDEKLFSDFRNISALKYCLLVALEAAGSICVHICARRLNRAVSEYPACFEFLKKEGIVSESLGQELIKMARFRNMLVHQYWEINDHKVVEYARNELSVFGKFVEAMNAFIQKKK